MWRKVHLSILCLNSLEVGEQLCCKEALSSPLGIEVGLRLGPWYISSEVFLHTKENWSDLE